MTTLQKTLGIAVWVFFAAETLRTAFWFPFSSMFANRPVSDVFGMLLLPFIGFAVFAGLDLGLPRAWRQGRYAEFLERMQLRWVPVMFFGCGGGVAALRGYLQGMPVSNLYFQLFIFSGGLGFLVGNLYRAYRQR